MAFANLSFETEGDTPGSAYAWTYSGAAPNIYARVESFEVGWGADVYKTTFVGFNVDLAPVRFRSALSKPQFAESFSEGWSNTGYAFALVGSAAPFGVETFETGWRNDGYTYAPSIFPASVEDFTGWGGAPYFTAFEFGDLVQAPGGTETFETGWALATSV